jgi:hypothetical protein
MYERIERAITKDKADWSSSAGKAAIAVATGKAGVDQIRRGYKNLKAGKKFAQRKGMKLSQVVDKKGNKFVKTQVLSPMVAGIATMLGIGIPVILSVKKSRGNKKRAIDRLTKMVQQGDIDPSELFQYLKSSNKDETAVVLATLDNIGYNGQDVNDFVGYYRKNVKGR